MRDSMVQMKNLNILVLAFVFALTMGGCSRDESPIVNPPQPEKGATISYNPPPSTSLSVDSSGGTMDITVSVSDFKIGTDNIHFEVKNASSPITVSPVQFALDAANPTQVVKVSISPNGATPYMQIYWQGFKGKTGTNQPTKSETYQWKVLALP